MTKWRKFCEVSLNHYIDLQSTLNDITIMTKDVRKHPHTYISNGKINPKNFGNGLGSGAACVTKFKWNQDPKPSMT